MIEKLKQWWLKRKKRIVLIAVLAVFAGLIYVCNQPVLHGPYYVKYVYDGDTLLVDVDGQDTKIRLIGIDTPELIVDQQENQAGVIAKEYTEKLVNHKMVYLQYDKERTDKYDRVLAYVYLDESRMVNKLILSSGNAKRLTISPNTRYSFSFWCIEVMNYLFLK